MPLTPTAPQLALEDQLMNYPILKEQIAYQNGSDPHGAHPVGMPKILRHPAVIQKLTI